MRDRSGLGSRAILKRGNFEGVDRTAHPPEVTGGQSLLICDLTQSYSPKGGGGIGIYLAEKRHHILERTEHRLLQIVPGPEDRIVENGRHIWCEVGAEPVRGSPNYRFITRTRQVRRVLARYRPDIIESLCPWVLPWTAINHRRSFPGTALVAGYRTDFPEAHVHRVARDLGGAAFARFMRFLSFCYGEITYREFDRVYALGPLSLHSLARMKVTDVDLLPLGVNTGRFEPARSDPAFRAEVGLEGAGPLLIYAGRLDNEKRVDRLIAMMRQLPRDFEAGLVLIGAGKLRETLENQARTEGLRVAFPGFWNDRDALARALASSDIYVSAMADETFGISVVEAQSCGLPVVGVASGAMPERVPPELGCLVPVDDTAGLARAVVELWPDRARAIRPAARKHVLDHYSWDHTFAKLLGEIYPKALAHARLRIEQRRRGGWMRMMRPASADGRLPAGGNETGQAL